MSPRSSSTDPVGAGRGVCYPRAVPPELPLPRAVLEHTDALFRVARNLTGRDEDAEDLVQDTFARALGAHSQFSPGTNLRAWLFRILRNVHVDLVSTVAQEPGAHGDRGRRNRRRGPRPRIRSAATRILERLRGVVAEDIEAALASLSVDARTVILLDLEGLTETELSEVMGCSVGTVKSRLSRARAALRTKLRDYSR